MISYQCPIGLHDDRAFPYPQVPMAKINPSDRGQISPEWSISARTVSGGAILQHPIHGSLVVRRSAYSWIAAAIDRA
jgi:hypothetical protein